MKKLAHGAVFIGKAYDPPLLGTWQASRKRPHVAADNILAKSRKGVKPARIFPRDRGMAQPRQAGGIPARTVKVKEIVQQSRAARLLYRKTAVAANVVGKVGYADCVLQAVRADVVAVGGENMYRRMAEQGTDKGKKGLPVRRAFKEKGFAVNFAKRLHISRQSGGCH